MRKRFLIIAFASVVSTLGLKVAAGQPQPQDENAALRYWMAFALLEEPRGDTARIPLMERVLNGQADWNESELGPVVQANESAIHTLRRGAALPTCDWGLDYELGPRMPVAHLAKARTLGRLAALAAIRSASRGEATAAADVWIASITFSKHVAQGGSLISLLTARSILSANLRLLTQAAQAGRLEPRERLRVARAIQALPSGTFNWGDAIRKEQASIEATVRELAAGSNRLTVYQALFGTQPSGPVEIPTAQQMQAFRRTMEQVAAALDADPSGVGRRLEAAATSLQALPPLLRDSIPSISGISQARVEVGTERAKALNALTLSQR